MVAKKTPIQKDSYKGRIQIIEGYIKEILETIDEPDREGIRETPNRVARMFMDEIYHRGNALEEQLSKTFTEPSETREMIVVKDIPVYSFCEHHILPWFGSADVGYIPNGSVLGLSKIARLVQAAGIGLTIQERVTDNIANALDKKMRPYGVIVVIRATHTCMVSRGVKAGGDCSTVISAIRGVFRDSEAARNEFFSMISCK
jgi:GTP cyclohydrolase I